MFKIKSDVIAAGLALFSMFFGAGDLIWPLILGGSAGDKNFYAMLGLLITGVSLPLLGLIAMMLFQGNYREFFGRVGVKSGIILIFVIQAILGPLGTIPRAITLSFATLKPYFPFDISIFVFAIISSVVVLAFTLRPQKLVSLLGLVLTPMLLLSLGAILVLGFWSHPEQVSVPFSRYDAFTEGLKVGYNTLDLIASFLFAPLVLFHFVANSEEQDTIAARRSAFKKMVQASLIAAGLLSVMYIGLTYVSSFYTPLLDTTHQPEERLSLISMLLLGPYGALVSCIAVALACLTTAIPLAKISADYIKDDLLKSKSEGSLVPLLITLGISCAMANLGFMGIAKVIGPVLQILCPSLIVLSVLNIMHKLYETRISRVPVYATFAISTIGHVL